MKPYRSLFSILLLVLLSFTSGCQHKLYRQFDKIKVGQGKDEVLDLMGAPNVTLRRNSVDRWLYKYYNDTQLNQKEIHFQEGKVIYSGDPVLPAISAAEQDNLNEQSNLAAAQAAAKAKIDNQNSYQQYETDLRDNDTIRYVPRFEPVK